MEDVRVVHYWVCECGAVNKSDFDEAVYAGDYAVFQCQHCGKTRRVRRARMEKMLIRQEVRDE